MSVLIVSDIHGAIDSANKIARLDEIHHFEKIILLGDINYHGPRNPLPNNYNPKEVINILNGLKDKIICVRGNCDADVEAMVLDFECMTYLKTFYYQGKTYYLSHGHIYNESKLPEDMREGDTFMYGHTHIPVNKKSLINIFNPGSITLPKENHPRTYGILDDQLNIYTIDDELYM